MSSSSLSPLASLLPPGVSVTKGLELFFQVVQDTFTTNLVAAAAVTWMGYDICLTVAEEVELVWRSRWTLSKFLYIGVRYYGFAAALFYFIVNTSMSAPFQLCRGWGYYGAFGATTPIVLLSEALFLLRIWIAYGKSKKILAFVLVCYIAEIASSLAIGIVEGRHLIVLQRPSGFPLPGCFTTATVSLKNTLPAWVVTCATSTSYLVLMIHQFVNSHAFKAELIRVRRDPLGEWFQLHKLSPLVYLLVTDGLLYFAMMFSASTLNMAITIHFNRREIQATGVPVILAVSSISASRLTLNLRGVTALQREKFPSQYTTMYFEPADAPRGGSAEDPREASIADRPSATIVDA
ncbi:hypothetical protein BD310DRAFT_578180 [Dichomitus squalens]|uniref:DUF6533 domain-containing protein n=1 Tax=Dichomitus squalens TaxID=114155 RepID=A0A4Q9Q8Q2_9APHY|nr:hypothetical protein BD310DRAFT_578180 [Dichomitus squalens]